MPEVTPNFNIPYPCSGETIDCSVFESFTEAVQDGLDVLDLQQIEVLNRPAARIQAFANGQTFTVAVATNVVFDSELFDNDAMANLAVNNDRLTIQSPGMYLVSGSGRLGGAFTTVTSESVAISLNGSVIYRKKESSDTNNLLLTPPVIGLVDCVAGDILRLVYLWTGTGGPNGNGIFNLSAYRVSAP